MLEDKKEIIMATTNYSKADAVMTKLVSEYNQTKGFRGATVECQRNLGTYSILVHIESGTKHEIPKSIDHVDIEIREVKARPIR